MQPLRTFVAVEISPEVRSQALRLIDRLRASGAKVKWTEAANLHWTLKFLGDVPAVEVVDVCRAVQEAAAPFTPFEIVARGVGAFPSIGRPRTLWLGVGEGAEPMELLFQAIDRTLGELGYPPEPRHFTPHLTLGRVRDGGAGTAELTELLKKLADFDAGAMTVDEVVTFSSTLSRDGPTHEPLARAELQG